ncbi:MAG: insulinase family protein [Syntrophales bacterium]|nr:insulinase family protein [Syntrophales bacterium]MDY0044128.1 pitrilysin family protein [Syntrophales bacterium]
MKKIKGPLFLLFSAAGCFFILFSAVWGAEYMESVREHRLPNGMKVILLENHKAPVVTFQVWYRAGSRNDTWGKTGLAHTFEHLMFKGTKNVGREEFTRRIQEVGGEYNAFTSHDYAAYFENVAREYIEIPIRLEADRMHNLHFTKEDFETEKRVVMEERRLRTEDQPKALLIEQLMATAFQAQPYHWPIIGWMDDLKRISYEDALRFYRNFYSPSNGFISIVGDFKSENIIALLAESFGAIQSEQERELLRYKDPPQLGERRVYVTGKATLPFVAIGYHVPSVQNQDGYVLEIISALASAGKSSRLYGNLVLGQLATSAGTEYSLLSVDPSLFLFYAEPLPGRTSRKIEESLLHEIEVLKNTPVGEEELEKAKNQLESDFIIGQDSLFLQGMLLARYEIATSWKKIRKYIPGIRAVTSEDVKRVACTYFTAANRTVGILEPEAKEVKE